ncbi:MAG: MFS transporter [Veillonellaceae bacterium]|nr:MFS transporter [Veillonellaceae bacterium]
MNKARIDKIQSYIPGTCHCITDTAQGSIAALLPLFITQFGLNYYQVGLIMFVNTTVASVIQPIFGYLADRVRLPIFIPLGMMIAVCSIAAMTYAQSFPLLLLLSLTAGIGSALFHPEGAIG